MSEQTIPQSIEEAQALELQIAAATRANEQYEAGRLQAVVDTLAGPEATAFLSVLDALTGQLLASSVRTSLMQLKSSVADVRGQAASRLTSLNMRLKPPTMAVVSPATSNPA